MYISAGALILVMLSYLYKHKYNPNYVIIENNSDAYASYSNGLVYIGDEKYINSLQNVNPNDVLIIDERNFEDPNVVICNSYVINNKDLRNEILEIICCYEKEYPSEWDRSIESMRFEWFCHNLSHFFNYKTDHTSEVDLNNKDEQKFDQKVLSRIFKI